MPHLPSDLHPLVCKCGMYHLCSRFTPQFLQNTLRHICKDQICANPLFRPRLVWWGGGGGPGLVCSFTLQLLFFVSLFFENATQLSIGPSIIVYHAKDKEYVSLLDCTIRLEGFYENNKRKARRNRIYERTYRVRQHEKVKLVNEPYFLTVCCFLFLFPELRQLTYSASMPIVSGHNKRCSTTLIYGVDISSSGQKKLKTFYLIIKCCGVQG